MGHRPPLTAPLIWQGGHPPDWMSALGLAEAEAPGALFALRGDPSAVRRLRTARPDALVVAVVDAATPEVEAAMLRAGASLVVDGSDPTLDRLRIQALGRPRRRSRTRMRALELSVALMQAAKDEEEFLRRLTAVVASELASGRVSIMQLDAERTQLVMRAAVGIPPEVVAHARTPVGQGIAGVSAQTGEPIYVDDHAQIRAGTVSARALAAAAPGTPMSLTVPIKARGEVVGVVNVTDRSDGQPYTPQDIQFIDALMRQAGFLLENARLMSGLGRLKAFNESVIDTIEDPLAVADAEGCVAASNRRFRARFGLDKGDRLPAQLPLNAEQRPVLVRLLAGETVPLEARVGWYLGDQVYDISAQPFVADGRSMVLLVLRDVTEKADRERRLLNAEKMASLGVLASGIAHEINNPLGFASSNVRTLVEYAEDLLTVTDAYGEGPAQGSAAAAANGIDEIRDDLARLAGDVAGAFDRITKIIKGLKSFVHSDTLTAEPTDLNGLVEGALLLTQGQWKRLLTVERDLAEGLPPIACLPTQLEQVLMNLVVNAAQAADERGGHTLRISTRQTPAGLEVVFTDDCGGVPAEVRDRIFEPFFTTKEIGVGSGLGLAISHNIIAAHGGELRLEVDDGVGSTFRITLPLGEAGQPMVVKQLSRYRV